RRRLARWKSRRPQFRELVTEIDRNMEAMSESVTTTETFPTIATLAAHEGQTVTLRGWLYNLRESGKLLFPIFRDGTGTIQGIVPKAAVAAEVFDRIKGLTQESSVIVTGKVR